MSKSLSDMYVLMGYSGETGGILDMVDESFAIFSGYSEENNITLIDISEIKEKYNFSKVLMGYVLCLYTIECQTGFKYEIERIKHVYFEKEIGDDVCIVTPIKYKNNWYLTPLDMYINEINKSVLLDGGVNIEGNQNDLIGVILVDVHETDVNTNRKLNDFENKFKDEIMCFTGDLGRFLKKYI